MAFTYAQRFKVKIYRIKIAAGEIHLLVKSKDRKGLADFLRVFAGRLAVFISGAKKTVKKIGKFWNELCWSRVIQWGQDFFNVRKELSGEGGPGKRADRENDDFQVRLFDPNPGFT